MVQIIALFSAALFISSGALAAPRPDSSINEPAVSAPNGTPVTEIVSSSIVANAAYGYGSYDATTTAAAAMAKETMMMGESSSAKMMAQSSSKKMMAQSSSKKMMDESTSTMMAEATSAAAAIVATTTSVMYGSGSSSYGSGYDNCVQQCVNSYGAPPAQYTAPPSTTTAALEGSGGGATKTIIVAPTKGVLRFVPFTVNATVGDTLHFVWGAGPHTVTQGSILEPCNKTSAPGSFTSGPQNATFTFDQVVNDTNPIFFFCNVPGHCPKGMFGVANAPNANPAKRDGSASVGSMWKTWTANNTELADMLAYTQSQTKGNSAFAWGDNLAVDTMPEWSQIETAKNILYSRLVFAANPGMLEGGSGAANPNGSPITIPADITQLSAAAGSASSSGVAANAGATATAVSTSAQATGSAEASKSNGAGSFAASSLAVLLVSVVATFMAL